MNDLYKHSLTSLLFEDTNNTLEKKQTKGNPLDVEDTKNIPSTTVKNIAAPKIANHLTNAFSSMKPKNWDDSLSSEQKQSLIFKKELGGINSKQEIITNFCMKPIQGIKLDPFNIKEDQHVGIDSSDWMKFKQRQVMVFVLKDKNNKVIGAESSNGIKSFYALMVPPLYTNISDDNYKFHKDVFAIAGEKPEGSLIWYESFKNIPVIQISTDEKLNHEDLIDRFLKTGNFGALAKIAQAQPKIRGTKTSSGDSDKESETENTTSDKNENLIYQKGIDLLLEVLTDEEAEDVKIDSDFLEVEVGKDEEGAEDVAHDKASAVKLIAQRLNKFLINIHTMNAQNIDSWKKANPGLNLNTQDVLGNTWSASNKQYAFYFVEIDSKPHILYGFDTDKDIISFESLSKKLKKQYLVSIVSKINEESAKNQIPLFNRLFKQFAKDDKTAYENILKVVAPGEAEDLYDEDKKEGDVKGHKDFLAQIDSMSKEEIKLYYQNEDKYIYWPIRDYDRGLLFHIFTKQGKYTVEDSNGKQIHEDSIPDHVLKSLAKRYVNKNFSAASDPASYSVKYKSETLYLSYMANERDSLSTDDDFRKVATFGGKKFYELVNKLLGKQDEVKKDLSDVVYEEINNRLKAIRVSPDNIARDIHELLEPLKDFGVKTGTQEAIAQSLRGAHFTNNLFNASDRDNKAYAKDLAKKIFDDKSLDRKNQDKVSEKIREEITNYLASAGSEHEIVCNMEGMTGTDEDDIDSLNVWLVNRLSIDLEPFFVFFKKRLLREAEYTSESGKPEVTKDDLNNMIKDAYFEFTGFGQQSVGSSSLKDGVEIKNKNLLNEEVLLERQLLNEGVGEFLGMFKGSMVGSAAGYVLGALVGVSGFLPLLPFVIGGSIAGIMVGKKIGAFLDKTDLFDKINSALISRGIKETTIDLIIEDKKLTPKFKQLIETLIVAEVEATLQKYFLSIADILKEFHIRVIPTDIIGEPVRDPDKIAARIKEVKDEIEEDEKFENLNDNAAKFLDKVYDMPYEISKQMGPVYSGSISAAASKMIMTRAIKNSKILNEIMTAYANNNKVKESKDDESDKTTDESFVHKMGLSLLLEKEGSKAKGYRKKAGKKRIQKIRPEELIEDIKLNISEDINQVVDLSASGMKEFESYARKKNYLKNEKAGKLKTSLGMGKSWMEKKHVISVLSNITGVPSEKFKELGGLNEESKKSDLQLINKNLANPNYINEDIFICDLSKALAIDSGLKQNNNSLKSHKVIKENIFANNLSKLLFEDASVDQLTKAVEALQKSLTKAKNDLVTLESNPPGESAPEAELSKYATDLSNTNSSIESLKTELVDLQNEKFFSDASESAQAFYSDVSDYASNLYDQVGVLTDEMTSLYPRIFEPSSIVERGFEAALLDSIPIIIWGFKGYAAWTAAKKSKVLYSDIVTGLRSTNLFEYGFATPIAYNIVKMFVQQKKELRKLGFEIVGDVPKSKESENISEDSRSELSPLFSQEAQDNAKNTIRAAKKDSFFGKYLKSDKISDEEIIKMMEEKADRRIKDILVSMILLYNEEKSKEIKSSVAVKRRKYQNNTNKLKGTAGSIGKNVGRFGVGALAGGAVLTVLGGPIAIPVVLAAAVSGGGISGWIGEKSLEAITDTVRDSREDKGKHRDMSEAILNDKYVKQDAVNLIAIIKSLSKKIKKIEDSYSRLDNNNKSTLLSENKDKVIVTSELKDRLKADSISIYRFMKTSDREFKVAENKLISSIALMLKSTFGIIIPDAPKADAVSMQSRAQAALSTDGTAPAGVQSNPQWGAHSQGMPSPYSMNQQGIHFGQLANTMSYAGGQNMQSLIQLIMSQQDLIKELSEKMSSEKMSLKDVADELKNMDGAEFTDNLEKEMQKGLETINSSKKNLSKDTVKKIYYSLVKNEILIATSMNHENIVSVDLNDKYKKASHFTSNIRFHFNLSDKDVSYSEDYIDTLSKFLNSMLTNKSDDNSDDIQKNICKAIAYKILDVTPTTANKPEKVISDLVNKIDIVKEARVVNTKTLERRKHADIMAAGYYRRNLSDLLFEVESISNRKLKKSKSITSNQSTDLQQEWRRIWKAK